LGWVVWGFCGFGGGWFWGGGGGCLGWGLFWGVCGGVGFFCVGGGYGGVLVVCFGALGWRGLWRDHPPSEGNTSFQSPLNGRGDMPVPQKRKEGILLSKNRSYGETSEKTYREKAGFPKGSEKEPLPYHLASISLEKKKKGSPKNACLPNLYKKEENKRGTRHFR